MPDRTRKRNMMPRTVFVFGFIGNSSLPKTGLFVIKFAINYKALSWLLRWRKQFKSTGLFPYWKQACHDDWSLRERCLHWGREVYNVATMSAMCCSVCVEIAMLSVMLQCLYWCCEICDENMMSRFLCWGYYSALAMMNTLSLRTSILSLYEQLTTQKNHQKCKANKPVHAIADTQFPHKLFTAS